MSEASLVLSIVTPGDLDGALIALGRACIERRDGRLVVECADDVVGLAVVLLARAGARAEVGDTVRGPAPSLVPALVNDLEPRATVAVDRISVRRIEGGEAAARLLRRGWRAWRARTDEAAVRRILRGEDRLYAWRRVIWVTATQLRSRQVRGVVPVVFDRGALTRDDAHVEFGGRARLSRWAQ